MSRGLADYRSQRVADRIEKAANGVQSHQADGTQVVNFSLADQIAADRYLAAKAQAKRRGFPGRRFIFRPPSAAGIDAGDHGGC